MKTDLERFEAKVERTSGCYKWLASKNKDGYGQFWLNKHIMGAHRAAWLLSGRTIPNEMLVLHTCDTPQCTNIEHLYVGTVKNNVSDKVSRNRQGRGGLGLPGDLSGQHKLSWVEVREIRSLYKTGLYTHRALGAMFKIHPTQISNIIRNKNWRE